MEEIRQAAHSAPPGEDRRGAASSSALRPLRDKIDPEAYGGAYLVGLRGLSVIAHGTSSRVAIRNAILHGAHGARNEVVQRLTDQLGRGARAAAEAPAWRIPESRAASRYRGAAHRPFRRGGRWRRKRKSSSR